MRTPISDPDQVLIASNLIVCCTIDIDFMTKKSYEFISNRNGFIRHNDREGFVAAYKNPTNLAADILDSAKHNQYENLNPGDLNYEYFMSVRKVYNAIVEGILENVSHSKRNN